MTKSLVGEVKTLFDSFNSADTDTIIFLTNLYKKNFDFVINIKNQKVYQLQNQIDVSVQWIDHLEES